MKKYAFRLLAELFVVILVPFIFHEIQNRLHAGMVAGTVFILLGFYVIAPGLRGAQGRRCLSFWAGLLHLGLSAFPLLITRLLNAGTRFEDITVWGLPGPVFHQFSTAIYSLLMLATAIDLGLAFRQHLKISARN